MPDAVYVDNLDRNQLTVSLIEKNFAGSLDNVVHTVKGYIDDVVVRIERYAHQRQCLCECGRNLEHGPLAGQGLRQAVECGAPLIFLELAAIKLSLHRGHLPQLVTSRYSAALPNI